MRKWSRNLRILSENTQEHSRMTGQDAYRLWIGEIDLEMSKLRSKRVGDVRLYKLSYQINLAKTSLPFARFGRKSTLKVGYLRKSTCLTLRGFNSYQIRIESAERSESKREVNPMHIRQLFRNNGNPTSSLDVTTVRTPQHGNFVSPCSTTSPCLFLANEPFLGLKVG